MMEGSFNAVQKQRKEQNVLESPYIEHSASDTPHPFNSLIMCQTVTLPTCEGIRHSVGAGILVRLCVERYANLFRWLFNSVPRI